MRDGGGLELLQPVPAARAARADAGGPGVSDLFLVDDLLLDLADLLGEPGSPTRALV